MINSQLVREVNGCVSTGKEANVYHATTAQGVDRAIKVRPIHLLYLALYPNLTRIKVVPNYAESFIYYLSPPYLQSILQDYISPVGCSKEMVVKK